MNNKNLKTDELKNISGGIIEIKKSNDADDFYVKWENKEDYDNLKQVISFIPEEEFTDGDKLTITRKGTNILMSQLLNLNVPFNFNP